MNDFSKKVLTGVFLLAFLSYLIPLIGLYARIQTNALVGGFLPEGEYVGVYHNSETPFYFTVDKHNKSKYDKGYAVNIEGTEYSIFYSDSFLRMASSPKGNFMHYFINEDVVERKGKVYYLKTHRLNEAPFLYFTEANSKSRYNKMLELKESFSG